MAQILIIEDDPDVAALIHYRFQASGHSVRTEQNADTGLKAARESVPDLVIVDWMMPGESGLALCHHLRSDHQFSGTKILMISAKGRLEDIGRAQAAGIDDYVVKPFSPRDLESKALSLLS